jgi:hypothetical protein
VKAQRSMEKLGVTWGRGSGHSGYLIQAAAIFEFGTRRLKSTNVSLGGSTRIQRDTWFAVPKVSRDIVLSWPEGPEPNVDMPPDCLRTGGKYSIRPSVEEDHASVSRVRIMGNEDACKTSQLQVMWRLESWNRFRPTIFSSLCPSVLQSTAFCGR